MKKILSALLAALLIVSFTVTIPDNYPEHISPQPDTEQHGAFTSDNGIGPEEQASPCDDSGTPPAGGDTPN